MKIIYAIIILGVVMLAMLYSPIGSPSLYTGDSTCTIQPTVDFTKNFTSSGSKIENAPTYQYSADNSEGISEGINEGVIPISTQISKPIYTPTENSVSSQIMSQGPTFQTNRFSENNTIVPSNPGVWASFSSNHKSESSSQIVQNQNGVVTLNSDLKTASEPTATTGTYQRCHGGNYDDQTSECGHYEKYEYYWWDWFCHRHETRYRWIEEECPNQVPVGDGIIPLILLALGYGIYKVKKLKIEKV